MSRRNSLIIFLVLCCSMAMGLYYARLYNTDNDRLRVTKVSIPAGNHDLSAILYIPPTAHSNNPVPAVLVTHGISNAKETSSCIALEVSRLGFVSLALDLTGHGGSGGDLGADDPTFGVSTALEYLAGLDYVDSRLLGLVGHSLGAGAVRGAADRFGVTAVAFLGGGVGGVSESGEDGALSPTFPPNLLVAVGSHDVLFDIEKLETTLMPVFDTSAPVVPGDLYGNISSGTLRKLVVSPTIHLLEPVDPAIVGEVTWWMMRQLTPWRSRSPDAPIYLLREGANLVAITAFAGLVVSVASLMKNYVGPTRGIRRQVRISKGRIMLWIFLGLVLFAPVMGAGALLPFPPLIFGSSMAWWLLVTGLVGALVMRYPARRVAASGRMLLQELRGSLRTEDVFAAALMFLIFYAVAWMAEGYTGLGLMFIVPVFRPLTLRRLAVFPLYVPFTLVYFLVEGLYMHRYRAEEGRWWLDLLGVVLLRVSPYAVVLFLQYGGMYLLDVRLLGGFVGFFVEFLWAVVPIFALTIVWSWWLHRVTGRIWMGAVFNSLVVAWVSVGLFPFGSFM